MGGHAAGDVESCRQVVRKCVGAGDALAQPVCFGISTLEGALTSIYLASEENLENISGLYFDKCKPRKSSSISYNEDIGKFLWESNHFLCVYIQAYQNYLHFFRANEVDKDLYNLF